MGSAWGKKEMSCAGLQNSPAWPCAGLEKAPPAAGSSAKVKAVLCHGSMPAQQWRNQPDLLESCSS